MNRPSPHHDSPATGMTTILLCLLVALLEGLDLQSAGIAGPRMAQEFHLTRADLGWVFGISSLGLLPGAALGGWLADRLGRKRVLIWSVVLFGVFSYLTTLTWDYHSLLLARLLTGLGMGSAMPNLIALCTEAAAPGQRSTAVGAMYCGMPFGAAVGALIGTFRPGIANWHDVFYVGSIGPVLVAPLLAYFLHDSAQFVSARSESPKRASSDVAFALLHEGRLGTTAALWVSYLGTLMVLYFLMTWLQAMGQARGLSGPQAGFVLMLFNIGAGIGAIVIATIMDRVGYRNTVIGMYVGMVVTLAAFANSNGAMAMSVSALFCGMFLVGGQSVLYALAGHAYPTEVRGTGTGAAVAVGRVSSILGPVLAGQLFGFGQSLLVWSSIGLVVIAAIAAFIVAVHLTARETASFNAQFNNIT